MEQVQESVEIVHKHSHKKHRRKNRKVRKVLKWAKKILLYGVLPLIGGAIVVRIMAFMIGAF